MSEYIINKCADKVHEYVSIFHKGMSTLMNIVCILLDKNEYMH